MNQKRKIMNITRTYAVKKEYSVSFMHQSGHIIRPIGLIVDVKRETRRFEPHGIELQPTLNNYRFEAENKTDF